MRRVIMGVLVKLAAFAVACDFSFSGEPANLSNLPVGPGLTPEFVVSVRC